MESGAKKDEDDLEPLQMADSDDSNSQTSLEREHQQLQQQVIDDNNLLGDHFFDVKSEHCLQPLLPQQNSYNRNMVLTMSHSGVKFIIEKISVSLEQEFKVKEVRDKIIDRTIIEKDGGIRLDPELLEDARRMGREGILTNMVLFDMNREEAKQMA